MEHTCLCQMLVYVIECAVVHGVKCGHGQTCFDLDSVHLVVRADLIHVGVEGNKTKEVTTGPYPCALLHRCCANLAKQHEPPDCLYGQHVLLFCALVTFAV